jgi:hypothetical protein
MYTEEELTNDYIRAELEADADASGPVEFWGALINDLPEDERFNVVATLPGNNWTPSQVERFVGQHQAWSNGKSAIQVHIHNYHGLELRREKNHAQLIDTVVEAERQRRQTANWREQQEAAKEAAQPVAPYA